MCLFYQEFVMNRFKNRQLNLATLIEQYGSRQKLADALEIALSEIGNYFGKNARNITDIKAIEYEDKLELPHGYLDRDNENKEELEQGTFTIPEYNVKLSAGHGEEVINPDNIKKYHRLDEIFLTDFRVKKENLAIVQVTGDSMHPTLLSGELVVVDISKREAVDNQVFAITTKNQTWVKRYRVTPDGGKWQSDNEGYREYDSPLNNGISVRPMGLVLFSLGRKIN